ncbi:MAG TPA: WD40 repeat domain-containing protein [Planctomycetota bacterium]|nr:WD40 repeat domain-containing protein [Planctomycetota bacterium]
MKKRLLVLAVLAGCASQRPATDGAIQHLKLRDPVEGVRARVLACSSKQAFASYWNASELHIFDLATGVETLVDSAPNGKPVVSADFNPDGSVLALGDSDGVIRLVATSTGKETATISPPLEAGVSILGVKVAFSRKGDVLAAAYGRYPLDRKGAALGIFRFIDATSRQEISSFQVPSFLRPEDTVFSPDLGKALFGDSLYDLATHERKPVDMGGERALFTPDGSRALAVSHRTGVEIRVLSPGSGLVARYPLGIDFFAKLALFTSGGELVAIGEDTNRGVISVVDRNGLALRDYPLRHPVTFETFALTPDRTRLVSDGEGGSLLVWDLRIE